MPSQRIAAAVKRVLVIPNRSLALAAGDDVAIGQGETVVTNSQAREVGEALIAVVSTTASMGIDIDQLCHLSAGELAYEDVREDMKPFVSGAIYQ